jgi:SAM-dependent methyltransferase
MRNASAFEVVAEHAMEPSAKGTTTGSAIVDRTHILNRPSILARLFLLIVQHSVGGRRVLFPLFFEGLARLTSRSEWWTFMNYGYADDESDVTLPALKAEDMAERYCARLYHRVASAVDLKGKNLLEVSSGRGGGASYVRRYLFPSSLTGVDISRSAVAFCRRRHRVPGLRFVQGDAMDLPLFDASVDAVINIEASFCYPDFDRFLVEVRRVLKPNGHFLYADLRLDREVEQLRSALNRSGLVLIEQEDITAAVVRALTVDSARRRGLIDRHVLWPLRGVMRTFAGTSGTRMPTLLNDGRLRYLRFVLQKSE